MREKFCDREGLERVFRSCRWVIRFSSVWQRRALGKVCTKKRLPPEAPFASERVRGTAKI